jgi:archaellum biogenesis ATPase FlaH
LHNFVKDKKNCLSIKALYERRSDQEAPSSVQVLLKAFISVMETPGQNYVIVDALDECTDRDELLEVLMEIAAIQLSNTGKLHILVTSRQERDILEGLKGIATQTISLGGSKIDDDIAVHIHNQIERQPKLRRWPGRVKSEIERKLVERANGM